MVRVGEEIDDDLVQLVTVGLEDRHRLREAYLDLDRGSPQLVRQELDRLRHDAAERDRAALRRAAPRQREEVLHDPGAPLGGRVDLVRAGRERRIGGALPEQHRLAHHDGERVVQLVRYPGEQRAHGGDLLTLQELLRAFAHRGLERALLLLALEVEPPCLQEVLDPEDDFHMVERLRQKVRRTRVQGPPLRVAGRIGRQDHDWQELTVRERRPQLLQHGHTIQVRHHQIEEHEIRSQFGVQGSGLARVSRRTSGRPPGVPDNTLEKSDVRRLVVDDEDPAGEEVTHSRALLVSEGVVDQREQDFHVEGLGQVRAGALLEQP